MPDMDELGDLGSLGDLEGLTPEKLESMLAEMKGMDLEGALDKQLEGMSEDEVAKLLGELMGTGGGSKDGDQTLSTLASMLQGDALERMTDEQLEGLYQDLLAANNTQDLQRVLQQQGQGQAPAQPASAAAAAPSSSAPAALPAPSTSSSGGSSEGGVLEAEVVGAEEAEGKKALEELLKLIDEEDLANDPELKDMRATFQQLKDLAGDMEKLSEEELKGKVQALVGELQGAVGEELGEDLGAGLEGLQEQAQLDALWQDALASTLATLVASSYQHFFQRPLLPGYEAPQEEAIDGSSELYRAMDSAPACLVYLDYLEPTAQAVEWANQAVCSALGVPGDELVGCSMQDLLRRDPASFKEWNELVAEVWDREPHAAVVPRLRLGVEGGAAVEAEEVEVFRVNSMGGEAIGVALRFVQFAKEGSSPVVAASHRLLEEGSGKDVPAQQ